VLELRVKQNKLGNVMSCSTNKKVMFWSLFGCSLVCLSKSHTF